MNILAVGVGCRRGAFAEDIVALVQTMLAGRSGEAKLFSLDEKRDEAGLVDAAALLGLALEFLPRALLAAQNGRVQTASALSMQQFGVASVAECAALAGAGTGARLVAPRQKLNGVTCAIARD